MKGPTTAQLLFTISPPNHGLSGRLKAASASLTSTTGPASSAFSTATFRQLNSAPLVDAVEIARIANIVGRIYTDDEGEPCFELIWEKLAGLWNADNTGVAGAWDIPASGIGNIFRMPSKTTIGPPQAGAAIASP